MGEHVQGIGSDVVEHLAQADVALGLMDELALVLAFGLIGGLLALRLRLPAIVGFLVAGIMMSAYTPGFVADTHTAEQLGEIGVAFLMFGVGMHFSIKDLLAVKHVAVPGAILQSILATAVTLVATMLFGWSLGAGIVLGLALSVASTVVLVRALMARGLLEGLAGKIAVGWLVVEDLFSALVLILLPVLAVSLGGHLAGRTGPDTLVSAMISKTDSILAFTVRQNGVAESIPALVAVTFVNVALVVAALPLLRRAVSWLLEHIDASGSEEMLTLAAVVVALFVAFGLNALFGISVALGAFIAGLVVAGSRLAHRVTEDVRPLRNLFGVLFFASVGMLFDPMTLVRMPVEVAVVAVIIVAVKPAIAAGIALALGQSRRTALTIGAGLAQIGEFSFILATLGRSLGLLPGEAYQLIITGAIVSIALNPVAFRIADALLRAWEPMRADVMPLGPDEELALAGAESDAAADQRRVS